MEELLLLDAVYLAQFSNLHSIVPGDESAVHCIAEGAYEEKGADSHRGETVSQEPSFQVDAVYSAIVFRDDFDGVYILFFHCICLSENI